MYRMTAVFIVAFFAMQFVASAQQYNPPQHADSSYCFGVNWWYPTPVNDSPLGFNNLQVGGYANYLNSLHTSITYNDSTIGYWASGERLLYTPQLRPNSNDTLTHYYFLSMDTTRGEHIDSLNGLNYWQVPSSTDTTNILLMSQNEMGGEWKWLPDSLRLAVRLQISRIAPPDSDSTIIASITVQFDTTWNIPVYDTNWTSDTLIL